MPLRGGCGRRCPRRGTPPCLLCLRSPGSAAPGPVGPSRRASPLWRAGPSGGLLQAPPPASARSAPPAAGVGQGVQSPGDERRVQSAPARHRGDGHAHATLGLDHALGLQHADSLPDHGAGHPVLRLEACQGQHSSRWDLAAAMRRPRSSSTESCEGCKGSAFCSGSGDTLTDSTLWRQDHTR